MRTTNYPVQGFSERLQEVVFASNLSYVEIGKKCKIDRKTVSAYVNGDTAPNVTVLAKLCVILNVSADYLLFGKVDN